MGLEKSTFLTFDLLIGCLDERVLIKCWALESSVGIIFKWGEGLGM